MYRIGSYDGTGKRRSRISMGRTGQRSIRRIGQGMIGRIGPRIAALAACAAAAGCVHGYGACLWIQPVKHTLGGRVHFRSYPTPDGIDHVPVLALDRTAYLYSPALSTSCQPVNELQLVGVSEFPENVVEDSHVSVQGKLFDATSAHDHTRYLMNVITLLPDPTNQGQPQDKSR
jgi:hypothetical protein